MEHGLDTAIIVAFTATLIVWAAFASRLAKWSVTPAIVFVAAGMIIGGLPLSSVDINPSSESMRSLAEVTLAVVLFTDAARVDVGRLRREAGPPVRLLFVGLPLTVAAGYAVASVVFGGLDPWLCAVIAAAVAPTDAALGAPLMADLRIPAAVRQLLNVESGVNDGLITPIVTLFIAGAVAEVGGSASMSVGGAIVDLGLGVVTGIVVGGIGAVVLGLSRRKGWTTAAADSLVVVALALLAYAAAVELDGNGFVAAFVGGLTYGAVRRVTPELLEFASEAGELLAGAVWFTFGAVALGVLQDGPLDVWLFALLAVTVARMLPVALAMIGSGLRGSTVAFVGWFGPRGLASVVFGLIAYDELRPGDGRTTVLAAVTATVLTSVVAHGLTAGPLAGVYATAAGGSDSRTPTHDDARR